MREADAIVKDMLDAILADFKARKFDITSEQNNEALLLINGFGATPLMELYLIYNSAARSLSAHGIKVAYSLVGNFTTALDMAGASISVCLLDEEIKRHWVSPVHTVALRW